MIESFSLNKFKTLNENIDYLSLDIRDYNQVVKDGFIPNTLNVSLFFPNFEIWASKVVNKNKKLIIVSSGESIKDNYDASVRLDHIGYIVEGYLEGGFGLWKKKSLPIDELKTLKHLNVPDYLNTNKNYVVLDVREKNEWERGVLPNSINISLGDLEQKIPLNLIPKDKEIISLCGAGIRSQMATSLLYKNGYKNVLNIEGGINKILEKGIKLVKYMRYKG